MAISPLNIAFNAIGTSQVSLYDLRSYMGGTRQEQDQAIQEARKSGKYFLEMAESRLTREEREASIVEFDVVMAYIGKRQ